jgi:hypothetical protein
MASDTKLEGLAALRKAMMQNRGPTIQKEEPNFKNESNRLIDWVKLDQVLKNKVNQGCLYVDLLDGIAAFREGFLVKFIDRYVAYDRDRVSFIGQDDEFLLELDSSALGGVHHPIEVHLYKPWSDTSSEECRTRLMHLNRKYQLEECKLSIQKSKR